MYEKSKQYDVVALESVHCPIPSFDLRAGYSYTLKTYTQSTPDDVPQRIANADIVLITTCRLNASALKADVAPKLKLIVIMAAGTDCVDLSVCRIRGIDVVNCPGANVNAVSEHAIGLYFAARRSTTILHNDIVGSTTSKGRWVSPGCLLHRMGTVGGSAPLLASEETLGIFGYGTIGTCS